MKKIYNYLILGLFATTLITTFNSCEEDDNITVDSGNSPALLSVDINSIELDANNASNPALTLSWTPATYTQQTAIDYTIELSTDESFSTIVNGGLVTATNAITWSMTDLNNVAGSLGYPPFAWNTIYARVISSIGSQNDLPTTSNTVSFEVYPYFNYPFNDYYLVGNATLSGWNNNNVNPALFRDENDSDIYYYTGYYDKASADDGDGRFKVLELRGAWQPQWGTTFPDGEDPIEASGGIAGNPGTQDSDPGRFGITSSGFYTFTIDFGSMNFSIEPYDNTGASDFTSITIQGSALDASVELTQSDFDSHIWYSTGTFLTSGDLQFITNTGSAWGGETSFSGQATQDGQSVPVIVQDEYEIWFNDLTGRYIMIPLNL